MKSTKLVGTFILLLGLMVGVAPALGRIAKRAVLQRGGGLSESPQTAPVIRTDKEGYLAGEVTAISGEGFSPFERVMLRVSHIDGTVEAGMGHDAWFVDADANGAFRASWSVNIHDTAGADLKLEAAGSSGLSAQAAFARTGRLALDRSSGAGSKSRVTGEGFNSNELVTIKLDGSEHQSISALSDANGNISAELSLTSGNVEAGAFSIQAASKDSAMVLSLNCSPSGCTDADFLADFFVVRHQSIGGQPLIRDVPADKELTQMGRNVDATDYNIFMSWDGTDQWTGKNTGDACALFDTNGDANGNIDFAICGQIINSKDGTKIFQTTASPFAFTCDNTLGNRCGTPVPYSTTVRHPSECGQPGGRQHASQHRQPDHKNRSVDEPSLHSRRLERSLRCDLAHGDQKDLPASKRKTRKSLLVPIGRKRRQQQSVRLHRSRRRQRFH